MIIDNLLLVGSNNQFRNYEPKFSQKYSTNWTSDNIVLFINY